MITFISWFGTAVSILGAFLLPYGYMQAGYILFTLGSISWLTVGLAKKDRALCLLNGTFLCANLLGLYKNFA